MRRPHRDPAASLAAQDSLAGRGAIGTLRDPSAVGRPRAPTDPEENAAEIQAIELRLACNCGCTLDVFTCRTTDFSCTYSPQLHREVLALRNQGKTAQQVIDAFVDEVRREGADGAEAEGVQPGRLPGARRGHRDGGRGAGAADQPTPDGPGVARRQAGVSGPPVEASAEELERLQRALAEVED